METNTYLMNNEASKYLKDALRDTEIKYQLVPNNNHKTNLSERAIQKFKGHFKAGLGSLDPYFPKSGWDKQVEQGELTLNILRASRLNPKLLTFTYLFGKFYYSATLLSPFGTKILVHPKPVARTSL